MSVQDPQQNIHRWWGTMNVEEGETITVENETNPLQNSNEILYFIKTRPELHFVTLGTRIKEVRRLANAAAAKAKIRSSLKDQNDLPKVNEDLAKADFPSSNIFEIKELNYNTTSPLTIALNTKTSELFADDGWLDANETAHPGGIGRDHIKIGRKK
ncbi:MAG TPA: hypothetical protein VFW11_00135 [Cyclobacteriaceae bacterium]|nr:hypothetical protein [Cyclobacteriaceae bacterium]